MNIINGKIISLGNDFEIYIHIVDGGCMGVICVTNFGDVISSLHSIRGESSSGCYKLFPKEK